MLVQKHRRPTPPPLAAPHSLGRRRHPASSSTDSSASSTASDSSTTSTESTRSTSSSSECAGSSAEGRVEERWKRRRRRSHREHVSPVLVASIAALVLLGLAGVVFLSTQSDDESAAGGASGASTRSSRTATRSSTASSSSSLDGTASATSTAPPRPSETVERSKATAWFPVDKVRGVNLGSLFVFEPWMAPTSWARLGCSSFDSEWPCIEAVGADVLQSKFEAHWSSFYNETDFVEMARLGLNTVRIPLGYWVFDSLIADGERFLAGSFKYLRQVASWAKAAGLYIILDLHGAPGSQTLGESFTGQKTDTAGFFTRANFERAYACLENWTTTAHTDEAFSNVVAIHVVNEPLKDTSTDLISTYYPGAQKAVRDAEAALNVTCGGTGPRECLSLQFMAKSWGSGDPTTSIDNLDRVSFDDHNYAQWIVDDANRSREGYLRYLCTNDRSSSMAPVVVGEWSLSTIGGGELEPASDGATDFFRRFAAAQIWAAEQGAGQIFWSWKNELGSAQWGYQEAVAAGYIPEDLSTLDGHVCDAYRSA
ncbi:hypothetical protein JCM8208_002499 [Rhodotorula glutinis]